MPSTWMTVTLADVLEQLVPTEQPCPPSCDEPTVELTPAEVQMLAARARAWRTDQRPK